MTIRMLIDARHREETRVAVVSGNRIEEFDFESEDHKQIKGNIYLAKVTRVEPSLQAAFVDYGGNRHGFLAFSEIHPDYYQIPKEDREALLAEEAAVAEEEEKLRAEEEELEGKSSRRNSRDQGNDSADDGSDDPDSDDGDEGSGLVEIDDPERGDAPETVGADDEPHSDSDNNSDQSSGGRGRGRGGRGRGRAKSKPSDEIRQKRMNLRRRYKIQDVIQRRQVLLVQVVKEERGNKGAALTTYLSLAGRYCVLMPNSSHGGGISRKISNGSDRKRLKAIVEDLNLPKSMGCIVRTAGLQRTKTEIKRDFDYLARLWDEIREATLKSAAPAMIHSDSDLIKRAIRDIYNRDIGEVLVEGENGYRAAKDFMKLLMPSHARRVKQYVDPVPLFQRFGAEDELSAMYEPVVQLKSGGYLVINPTEALVSIDINSGRSTKEHGIEATAVSTNLEAAREIARQLRLRDMAGLVVIDFIDMENNSNIRKVEKAMKDALKNDRARIQVGRISSFGLMEMSRQRLRTGVLEASTNNCPHCDGTGLVRTASSAGLSALRMIEDQAARGKGVYITLKAGLEAAIFVLNNKRADIAEVEARYGVEVSIEPDATLEGARMLIEASGPKPSVVPAPLAQTVEEDDDDLPTEEDDEAEAEAASEDTGETRRPRRRRRRRGRKNDNGEQEQQAAEPSENSGSDQENASEAAGDGSDEDAEKKPRSRRRRRSRAKSPSNEAPEQQKDGDETPSDNSDASAPPAPADEKSAPAVPEEVAKSEQVETPAEEKPKPKRTRTRKKKVEETATEQDGTEEVAKPDSSGSAGEEIPAEKPKRRRAPRKKAAAKTDTEASETTVSDAPQPAQSAPAEEPGSAESAPMQNEAASDAAPETENDNEMSNDSSEPPRRGWWQRTFGN